jgi:Pvc16 N-terminal domain
MYTALRATSVTIASFLERRFNADPEIGPLFAGPGAMVVSLNTPHEMTEQQDEGLSVWLYRIVRDEDLLNQPRPRPTPTQEYRRPLPLRLHYLITPIGAANRQNAAETEHALIGKVLQLFHDQPTLRGSDLEDDFAGTPNELTLRLEALTLEETTRVYEALARSFQVCISYEVSVVTIISALEPLQRAPVLVTVPAYGIVTEGS